MRLPSILRRKQTSPTPIPQASDFAARPTADEIARSIVAQLSPMLEERVTTRPIQADLGLSPMLGAPMMPDHDPAQLIANRPLDDTNLARPAWPGAYKWNNPLFWVIPQSPLRRPGSLLSLEEMRLFCDRYDIIRTCINHLTFDTVSTPIRWKAREQGDTSAKTLAAIADMEQFMSVEGGLGGPGVTRPEFEYSIFEDLNTVGAIAVWVKRTRGGQMLELLDIDAATIRPRINAYGWPPPGDFKWEQWVYGCIQAMFMDDQILYKGIYKTSRTPYYKAPVEWLLENIQTAMGYSKWNRSWLQDGNTADTWIEGPESWTPDNFYTYTSFLDGLLSGEIAERVKLKMLPPGAKVQGRGNKRDMEFLDGEKWLARCTASLFGVHLSTLGFEGDEYAANGANAMRSTSSYGTGRLLLFRKGLYDHVALLRGHDSIECENMVTDLSALQAMATVNSTYVAAGVITPNEVRTDSLHISRYEDAPSASAADRLWMNGTMSTIEDLEKQPQVDADLAKQQATAAARRPVGANNTAGTGGVRSGQAARTTREKTGGRK